jgi:hypothetical protein
MHVPVLIFETNYQSTELWRATLGRQGVTHRACLVSLRGGTAPPIEEYFLRILETYRPKLLITSWRYIGPVVRKAERTMTEPRPVEKWVVSGYSIQELEEQARVSGWADMVYEKPIPLLYLATEVERRISVLSPHSSSSIIVATH